MGKIKELKLFLKKKGKMKKRCMFMLLIIPFFILTFGQWAPSSSSSKFNDSFIQCFFDHSHEPSFPISEVIFTPQNSSFQHILGCYGRNLRFKTSTTPKPSYIITAKHESHVKATIICSKLKNLQIRIRSGGHDPEGISYVSSVPFLVLDLFNLRSINIDLATETAWAQVGATMGELYYVIAKKSKTHAFPGGVCPTVALGGHISGGGYGNMIRKYGLSSDNIIDTRFIDINGQILNQKSMDEGLFWALRGGGASSFGVVLSYKIKLVLVPAMVTVFKVERTLEQGATNLIYRWQQIAHKIDNNLFIRLRLTVEPKIAGSDERTVYATFISMYLGRAGSLLKLMKSKFPELGLQQRDCLEMSWVNSTLFWYDYDINKTPTKVLLNRTEKYQEVFSKSKSDFVKKLIAKDELEAIWKEMIKVKWVRMQWNPYGGRMSEISEIETPFCHRGGNIFMIQYYIIWFQAGIDAENYHIYLIRRLYEFMTPYVSTTPREAFMNYRDYDIGRNLDNYTDYSEAMKYGIKYFGETNFHKLILVKTASDPYNFFKNGQSIPSLVPYCKDTKLNL